MVEIKGELAVTFKVKSSIDVQRIISFCSDFEGTALVTSREDKSQNFRNQGQKRHTRQETYERVIDILKAAFGKDGFEFSDAAEIVQNNLGLGHSSTKQTIKFAKEKGILLKRGRGFYFTEFVKGQVAERISAESPQLKKPIDTFVSNANLNTSPQIASIQS